MQPVIETKALDTRAYGEDDLARAFEAYRETNDQRLAEIEARGADPLTEEKLARIDASRRAQAPDGPHHPRRPPPGARRP